jgi:hypothetical protein
VVDTETGDVSYDKIAPRADAREKVAAANAAASAAAAASATTIDNAGDGRGDRDEPMHVTRPAVRRIIPAAVGTDASGAILIDDD